MYNGYLPFLSAKIVPRLIHRIDLYTEQYGYVTFFFLNFWWKWEEMGFNAVRKFYWKFSPHNHKKFAFRWTYLENVCWLSQSCLTQRSTQGVFQPQKRGKSGRENERGAKWLSKNVRLVRSRGITLEIFQFEIPFLLKIDGEPPHKFFYCDFFIIRDMLLAFYDF